jgi:hypothetical protein
VFEAFLLDIAIAEEFLKTACKVDFRRCSRVSLWRTEPELE